MRPVHVAVFLEFKFEHVASFADEASAIAHAHGVAYGYRLAGGQGAIYIPILPRDSGELGDVITDVTQLDALRDAMGAP